MQHLQAFVDAAFPKPQLIVTNGRLSFLTLHFFALGLTVFALLRADMKISLRVCLAENLTCKRSLKSVISQITHSPTFQL